MHIYVHIGIGYPLQYSWAFCVFQLVKNLPAMYETWFQSLGWEYPLEKGKGTHCISGYLVFWPKEFHGLYSPQGRKESDTAEPTFTLETRSLSQRDAHF